MAYIFRGKDKYVPPVKPLTFDETKCGTRAGYRQHQNHGIYICDKCRQANTEYMKAYYRGLKACG